ARPALRLEQQLEGGRSRGRTLIEHPGNRSRQVRLACGAEVAESSQFGRDCAQTAPLTRFGAPTRQLSGGTDLRPSQWPCSALTRSHVWRKIAVPSRTRQTRRRSAVSSCGTG